MLSSLNHRVTSAALALATVAVVTGCSGSVTSPTGAPTPDQNPPTGVPATAQEITLSPPANPAYPGAHGTAKYKSEGQPELEIEIEDMRPGVQVEFLLDAQSLGSATVSTLGSARLDLRGAAAPAVAGRPLQVRTADGIVVVEGLFQ